MIDGPYWRFENDHHSLWDVSEVPWHAYVYYPDDYRCLLLVALRSTSLLRKNISRQEALMMLYSARRGTLPLTVFLVVGSLRIVCTIIDQPTT